MCVRKYAVHRWATLIELNRSCFPISMSLAELKDRQGRICALSECLLFQSQISGHMIKSTRLPYGAWGSRNIKSSLQL